MHPANPRLYPSSIVPPFVRTMTEPPPLAYTGPFQIIEPGSELYIDTEPNFCLELLPEEGLDTSGGLFLSENGIPAEVLEDAFRLEDEMGGGVTGGPVPEGVTMDQYEVQLVAEIEKLFPDSVQVGKRSIGGDRFAEELAKKIQTAPLAVSNSPCYMNVFLKGAAGGFLQNSGVSKSTPLPPTERGYRCVEMVDGTGTLFKAKYYADQMMTTTPVRSSTPIPRVMSFTKFPPTTPQQTSTPTRLPQLKNMTLAMANKIESLANGMNRNVTLTPVRTPSRNSLLSTPSSSTIVIKAPKRTIASGSGPAIFPDPFFPMPMIKQEPLDEFPAEDPLNIPAIALPAVPPSTRQPRKQKLVKLSQNGEVVFNDTTNVGGGSGGRRGQQMKVGELGTRESKKHPQRPSTPKPSRSSLKQLPSTQSKQPPPIVPAGPAKRTRYRVHMTQTTLPQQQHRPGVSKRVPINQTIESIEILDSSEDDEEETTTAPESSEPESDTVVTVTANAVASHPKLPGNTESIQCPYCCRIFRSSQAVLEHAKNCADASLFRKISKNTPGQSLLKGFPATIAQPAKKPAATKRSERLSIEILPSAFNIDNLLLCKACQKSFRTVEHLQQHQRIHQAPVVCEFCKRKFYETLAPNHVCQEKKRSMS